MVVEILVVVYGLIVWYFDVGVIVLECMNMLCFLVDFL